MDLTPHQQEKFNEIINLIRSGHKRIILKGSAGVGKTFLVSELVKTFKRDFTINPNYNNGQVYVTAPTNKALSVLMGKINTSVEFKTIHAALNMKPGRPDRATGYRPFIRVKSYGRKEESFRYAKIGVIDECSMLNSDFVGGREDKEKGFIPGFLDDISEFNFPIIFIGDDKQINPVGEPFSPVFHQGYPEVELTEIVRQGAGNPIIELSRDLDMIFFKTPKLIDGKGYLYNNDKIGIIEALAEVNGTDDLKYLAFTNDEIDEMNMLVRQKRYGNPKKIEKYETVVFNAPYGSFYTNQEVKVEEASIITTNVIVPTYKTRFDRDNQPINEVDNVRMKYYVINDSFKVVHEHSMNMFNLIKATLNNNCLKQGWDWRGKFFFEEQFADIKYNHAITVHKSQGSTYKESIMNVGNICINPKAEERQRLLYTGVTRASHLVILNNVK